MTTTPRKPRLAIDNLADRIVPAVDVAFANGVLTVTGDGANDTILVRSLAATGAIQVNGVDTGHTLSDTFGLLVDGNGGNDLIDIAQLNTSFFSQQPNLDGGDGNDTLVGSAAGDILTGGPGNDVMTGNAGNDLLDGGNDNDTLTGNLGNDLFIGGTGTDRIREVANVNVTITATTMTGLGTDQIGGMEEVQLTGGTANNRFDATAAAADLLFDGGAGNDSLLGGNGDDTLIGGAGNDSLHGGAFGLELLTGGAGSDTLNGGGGINDKVIETATGTAATIAVNGNALTGFGNDTLVDVEDADLTGTPGNDLFIAGNTEVDVKFIGLVDGGALGNDLFRADVAVNGTLTPASFNGEGTDALIGIDRALLIGSAGSNVISAATFNNPVTVEGRGGNDVIAGSAKNDVLKGEGGDDRIDGNDGNDVVDGGTGTDTVDEERNADFTLTDTSLKIGLLETDTLIDIEQADLAGGDGNNDIDALAFTGPTTLDGGAGNDEITGTNNADSILGGPGADTVFGRGGNDVINTGTGNDNIDAGSGDDTITGSFGNDTIDGSTGFDTLNEGFSSTTNKTFSMSNTATVFTDNGVNQGTDAISGLERANIVMLAGNNAVFLGEFGGQATVIGGTGNDRIAGGKNNDILDGGAGFDVLRVITDNATLSLTNTQMVAEGLDLHSNFEAAELDGDGSAQNFNATGFNGRTTMRGGAGNDTLQGGTNVDVLFGDAGNDRLEGNNGNDQLTGGPGADTLLGGNGNDAADSDLNDFIDLGAGEDGFVVQGTSGNDTILIRREEDANGPVAVVTINGQEVRFNYLDGETVTVFASGGNDRVEMDASAGAFWKALFFGEDGNDTLIGGAQDDFLNGGAGADSLDGGAGNDTLIGWTGRDTIVGGDGTDQVFAKDGLVDLLSVDGLDVVQRDAFDPKRK